MAQVMIGCLYIFILCERIGTFFFRITKLPCGPKPVFSRTVAGMTCITVYAECVSIFYKVAGLAHAVLLLTVGIVLYLEIREKKTFAFAGWKNNRHLFWEAALYLMATLLIAFFASRGDFHTDTKIYHAQNIAIYERYGLLRGMGNLQLHYAYNSAYLAFASVFSFGWLLKDPMHVTTGFLEMLFTVYALSGLKGATKRTHHMADGCRCAILAYVFVILYRSMSPATDFAAMLYALYIACAWAEAVEEQHCDIRRLSLLCVFAAFVATVKLSAASVLILLVYPVFYFLRGKSYREIGRYTVYGILVSLPFFVRNYLISGWLLYPFEGIDLFSCAWKVPVEYMRIDAAQIKVWGRNLFETEKIDMPFSEWLPVWYACLERYDRMLLVAAVLSALLFAVALLYRLVKRTDSRAVWLAIVMLYLSQLASVAVWLVTAPFIRYGLAFILTLIFLPAGLWMSIPDKQGFYLLSGGMLLTVIALSLTDYANHYYTDNGVFIKHNLRAPYYLRQMPYDPPPATKEVVMGGETVYVSAEGIVNSYYSCPGTCYAFMLERSTLLGDKLTDGFKPK